MLFVDINIQRNTEVDGLIGRKVNGQGLAGHELQKSRNFWTSLVLYMTWSNTIMDVEEMATGLMWGKKEEGKDFYTDDQLGNWRSLKNDSGTWDAGEGWAIFSEYRKWAGILLLISWVPSLAMQSLCTWERSSHDLHIWMAWGAKRRRRHAKVERGWFGCH